MSSFVDFTEQLWDWYFSPEEEDRQRLLRFLLPNCVVIGTGAHESYGSALAVGEAMDRMRRENRAQKVTFSFREFHCEETRVNDQTYLTHGDLLFLCDSADGKLHAEFTLRFSLGFCMTAEGWKVFHSHHSVPNWDQMDGEAYPRTLSAQMAVIQQRVNELRRLAERDALTNLLNLRTLQEIYDLHTRQSSVWLIELDLDDFKQINDTWGHVVGNEVLRKVANLLQQSVRDGDIVARTGGDEFVILLQDTALGEARGILNRIQTAMREASERETCWVGVSIGAVHTQREESLSDALARADSELYKVKHHGKNGFSLPEED